MAKRRIPIMSKGQDRHLWLAYAQLDDESKVITRVWELDWSLKGAEVVEDTHAESHSS